MAEVLPPTNSEANAGLIRLSSTKERARLSHRSLWLGLPFFENNAGLLRSLSELGVSRIFKREQFPTGFFPDEGMDCFQYIFGLIPPSQEASTLQDRIRTMHVVAEKNQIQKGDFVMYGFEKKGKIGPRHVGVIVDVVNGKAIVESKWGRNGDVFQHPLEAVPVDYGNAVKVFRGEEAIIPAAREALQ